MSAILPRYLPDDWKGGFGGSMIWFGSSAGVALASQFPAARSAVAWVRSGWHVALAYVISFAFMLAVVGWHPDASVAKTPKVAAAPAVVAPPAIVRAD